MTTVDALVAFEIATLGGAALGACILHICLTIADRRTARSIRRNRSYGPSAEADRLRHGYRRSN